MSVAPPVQIQDFNVVSGNQYNETWPALAIDPLNANNLAAVHIQHRFDDGLQGEVSDAIIDYSTDGGHHWSTMGTSEGRVTNPSTLGSSNVLPFQFTTDTSIAFDRNHHFYVLQLQKTGTADGQVLLDKFDFSGSAPSQTISGEVLAAYDQTQDQVYNPYLAVDNSTSSYTDPNGQTQSDPVSGNVYAAWNTDYSLPNGVTNEEHSRITFRISSDGGANFGPTSIFQDPLSKNHEHLSDPVIAAVQGQNSGLGASAVPGGTVALLFSHYDTSAAQNPSTVFAQHFTAPSSYTAHGNTGSINEAGAGTPNVPASTDFYTTVNINSSTAPNFKTVSDVSVTINMVHPHMNEVRIDLQQMSADGKTVVRDIRLLTNRTDENGTSSPPIGLPDSKNLGVYNGEDVGTTFTDGALRAVNDVANKAPYVGTYIPDYEGTSLTLSSLDGLSATDVNGSWRLHVIDYRNDSNPTQQIDSWTLNFASGVSPSASPSTVVTDALLTNQTGGGGGPFPLTQAVSPNLGFGPGLALAVDNTLGGYSPFQGRIYLAYVKRIETRNSTGNLTGIKDTGEIQLIVSDDGGASWKSPSTGSFNVSDRVNDDNPNDGFSEGNRTQFMPELAVDPATGDLAVSYLDARLDPSNARVVNTLAVSIDGGQSFSPQAVANQQSQTVDAITGKVYNFEPLPDNQSGSNSSSDTKFNYGVHHGLVAENGHIITVWAGNRSHIDPAADPHLLDIYATVAGYAAGPRIISSTMGSVAGSTLNNTFASDGQQLADRFEVLFDRPVDPNSVTGHVTVQFRSPTMNPSTTQAINLNVISVTPENTNAFGATRFLIKFDNSAALAQAGTYTGTYSYSVGPFVNDRIRSAPNGIGNNMDQNANGTPGEQSVDAYAAPRAVNTNFQINGVLQGFPFDNGVPFTLPYDSNTLPLIVSGPHVISLYVPGTTPTGDNLLLHGATSSINVVFDRDIDPTSFTGAQVLHMIGPIGSISGPFTVSANPAGTPSALARRTFQITFPTQNLNGTYSLVLASTIKALNNSDLLDTNLNAGLDLLRGGSLVAAGTNTPVTFTDTALTTTPLTIGPNATVTATLNITNPFLIQSLTTQLSITAANDPDLEATLVHPGGTKIKLFTNVGNNGPAPHSNFTNTVFDDDAATPIQQGVPPFNVGSFNPQIPLSRLKQKASNGTWKLIIKNDGSNTNTLTAWSLTLVQNLPGTGLGEPVADQADVHFRIFTQAPDNSLSGTNWAAIGGASNNGNGNSGRIGGIAVDPSDSSGNTVYVAGASGGVWKTSNFLTNDPSGPTYVPLLDLGPVYGLNIGSIAIFGRNNNPEQSIVVVGTGEGDGEAGAAGPTNLGHTGTFHGVGFLISTDGGKNWNLENSFFDASGNLVTNGFAGTAVFKILADPTPTVNGTAIFYAAVSDPNAQGGVNGAGGGKGGVYRSLDSGQTWHLMRAGDATDIAFANGSAGANGNIQVVYAGFRGEGVYESPNQGNSWNFLAGGVGDPLIRDGDILTQPALTVGAPPSTPNGAKGRIVLATPALTGNKNVEDSIYQGYIYAAVSTTDGHFDGLYMSKDFAQNWTQIQLPVFKPVDPVTGNVTGAFPTDDNLKPTYDVLANSKVAQGNYDISLAVDPTNPYVVYLGGTADFQPLPAGGLLRIDTRFLRDPHNLTAFNSHRNDNGAMKENTSGAINLKDTQKPYGLTTQPLSSPFLNLIRDPNAPFLQNNTLLTTNVSGFTNDGFDVRWMGFNKVVGFTTDQHRVFAVKDPLTGRARLLFGDDQGVWSGVDMGDGTLDPGIGTDSLGTGIDVFATGSRNGNLQITQNYYGAAQPSMLAAEIASALFYGSAQDDGFPQSPNGSFNNSTAELTTLQTGNLGWADVNDTGGDGAGVATDQTGGGSVYNYAWPCCNGFFAVTSSGIVPLTPTDFFVVRPGSPGGIGQPVGRTFGLLQKGDDPANGQGQWPFSGGSNFAVNPIDPNGIVISPTGPDATNGQHGRIFRTQDQGKDWFVIGNPTDLDQSYAPAVAFGAPHTSDLGNLDNFIYAGTLNGNIWVTTQGGGTGTSSTWKESFVSKDGTPVQQIVTNPKRDSNEAYAVTLKHVYHTMDSVNNPTWTDITGNLFSIMHTPFSNQSTPLSPEPLLQYLTSIQADWRFNQGGSPPVLYVGGEGGVFRSTDGGKTWTIFPDVAHQGAPADGGYLPNAHITALNLSLGDIDPATGLPTSHTDSNGVLHDSSTGFNLLVATTYGHGSYAIRLPGSAPTNVAGPVVDSAVDMSDSTSEAIQVTFGTRDANQKFHASGVDPSTFSPSDIVLKDPNGNVVTVQSIQDISTGAVQNYHNTYLIRFIGNVAGSYSLTIGPKVTDFSGTQMSTAYSGSLTVTPLARPQESLGYTDSFSNGFNALLGRQWLQGPGYFNTQNSPIGNPPNPNPLGAYPIQTFAVAQASGTNIAVLNLSSKSAGEFAQADVDVTSLSGSNAGLVARYIDGNNYYLGELQNIGGSYFATIVKVSGGVSSTLAHVSISAASGTLRFEALDDSLKLFLQPAGSTSTSLVAFAEDTAITAAGTVGLYGTQGTTFANFTSGLNNPVSTTLPFTDNFNNPSFGNQLSFNWVDRSGNISIINGQATGNAVGNSVSTLFGVNQADVKVTANVNLSANQTAGLVARYSGPLESNLYLGQLNFNGSVATATIWKNIGGTYTLLANGQASTALSSGTFEFEAVGPSLKVIFGGTLLAWVDDTSITAAGSVGMRLPQNVAVSSFHAEAVTQQQATLPFDDNFNNDASDGSQLSHFWTDQVGNISIVNGQAVGQAPGNDNLSTVNGISQVDTKVTATVALSSNQTAGLVTRYSGPLENTLYLGQLNNNGTNVTATIWKDVGGSYTLLASGQASTTTTSGTFEFETVGPSLKVFLGGTLLAWADDTSISAPGSVGMRLGQNVAMDNFHAEAVVQQQGSLPFNDNFSTTSDGSQLSRFWTDQAGNITVVGGMATGEAPGNDNLSTVNGISQADTKVTASVTLGANQTAGLVTRYSGPLENTLYLGQLNNNGTNVTATIWKDVGGSYTLLASGQASTTTTSGTFEFETVGPSLKVFLGGTLLAWADDTSISAPGSVGMRLGQNVAMDNFHAEAVVQQQGSLPFNDNFSTTSDGSQLSRFWTDQAGNITVVGGMATGEAPGNDNLSTVNGISQADTKVTASVTLGANQTAGLVTRYSGPLENTLYLGQLNNNGTNVTATIWKDVGGSYTLLASGQASTTTTSGTFEFESVGPSLKVIFGGQLLAWADDTSITAAGSVGMRLGKGVAMGSFHAEAVTQLQPPQLSVQPFNDDFSTTSDGAQLDRNWTDQTGNIGVVNGQASGNAPGNSLSTVNGLNQADVAVRADVTLVSGKAVGLITRYGGSLDSNYYLGQLFFNGTNVQATIWENLGGTYSLLTTGSTTSTQTSGTMEFETVGGSLKVIYNSQVLAFANNTTLTSGSVGMRLGQSVTMDNFHAEAVTQLTPKLPFSDNFSTTSDGSQLDRNWSDQIGNITVVGGKATGEAPGNNNLSTLNGVNVANVTVQASIALTSGQTVGLVSRYGGLLDSNYYLAQFSSSGSGFQATIWKNIGGTYTMLTTGSTIASGTGTLKFVTSGSSLQVFLDSTLLASVIDTSLTTGSVGMRLGQNAQVSLFQAS